MGGGGGGGIQSDFYEKYELEMKYEKGKEIQSHQVIISPLC